MQRIFADMKPPITRMSRISALIPAAGLGTRLGLGPKGLLQIGQRSLLEIVIQTVRPLVDEILVAIPGGYEAAFAASIGNRALVVTGGKTRQDSIENLIDASAGEFILIQDAARPFASRKLCSAVLDAAIQHGAAGAFLDPGVPVGRIEDGQVASYQSRYEAGIFQAPQAFAREVLLAARRRTSGCQFQSTAQMVIDSGYTLQALAGEPENIKITSLLDWEIAQRVIAPALGLDT